MDLIAPIDSVAGASVAYTGTAGSTAVFPPGHQGVLVTCTTDAYVKIGEGVTATTSDTFMPAYMPMAFRVPNGTNSAWRVSAIQVSAGGTVYAKPIAP